MDPYDKILDSILDSVQFIKRVDNDKEMADAYVDSYMTIQQRLRDKKITELLNLYVSGYRYKINSNKWYKGILLGCSCLILAAFSVTFIVLLWNMDFSDNASSITSMVEVITVCITFLSLIVGILTIITKYVFPEKEEEYITRIVEIIQNNDLENKKENIRAPLRNSQEDEEKKKIIEAIKDL